jgi:hypothetical protein
MAPRRPDAILLDLRMPGDYLLNDATTPAELAELGAMGCFKPLWLEELSDVVKELLKPAAAGT